MMRNDIQEVLFSEQQLADKVAELGARISADYEGKTRWSSACSRAPMYSWLT